eukprot:TCALIF_13215-PA protein Name:"Protein of unknown function" AED:0.06 eAED:0.06 QI:0/0.66/0.25/1/0/0.25/4/0/165
MELRASDQTRFFSSRYRSNPFRPPDVLGASNQDFDHVSEQTETFQAIHVEKRRSLKIGPSLRSEGEIDDRTIHRENYTEDIPRKVERTFLMKGARDANIQPNGGIEDTPSDVFMSFMPLDMTTNMWYLVLLNGLNLCLIGTNGTTFVVHLAQMEKIPEVFREVDD